MVGQQGHEPVQDIRQPASQEFWFDEAVGVKLIGHEVYRVVNQRKASQEFRHDPDERSLVIMGMNDIDPLPANYFAKFDQQKEIEKRFFGRRTDVGSPGLVAMGNAMHLRFANRQILSV